MIKHPIAVETLYKDFVEQIELLVDAVAAQVMYTPEQIFRIS